MVRQHVSSTSARVVRRRGKTVAIARRQDHSGQASIEFAFTFVLLLMGIFGTVSSALWSVQSMASVDSLQAITRITAAAKTGDPNNTVATLAPGAIQAAISAGANNPYNTLRSALFGTSLSVVAWNGGNPKGCSGGAHAVQICVRQVPTPSVNGGSTFVEVSIQGCAATLIPKFGFGSCAVAGGGVQISEFASVRGQVFTQ